MENDRNLKATAEELGVHPATMKHWVQKGIDGLQNQATKPSSTQEAEIKRLRKELNRLTEENEILIKAARMFAAQS
ncbi:transposase [Endozoicomonas euniceicola]|uniref:transposase n=1 Tax=Endozoicomonas euniceicola TaxID=1234143 RepID=UPI003850B0FE